MTTDRIKTRGAARQSPAALPATLSVVELRKIVAELLG
jgi:hypothetical protein